MGKDGYIYCGKQGVAGTTLGGGVSGPKGRVGCKKRG